MQEFLLGPCRRPRNVENSHRLKAGKQTPAEIEIRKRPQTAQQLDRDGIAEQRTQQFDHEPKQCHFALHRLAKCWSRLNAV